MAEWGWWEPPLPSPSCIFLRVNRYPPGYPVTITRCVRWALAQLGFGATAIEAVNESEGCLGGRCWNSRVKIWGVPELPRVWIRQSTSGFPKQVNVRSHDFLRVINNYCRGWRFSNMFGIFTPSYLGKMNPIWQAFFLFQMGWFRHQL